MSEIVTRIAAPKLTDPKLAMPEGLSPKGKLAWKIIVSLLEKADLAYTGGCRAFYSPAEWKYRGEDYGTESLLVIVYDGGDVGEAARMDGAIYEQVRFVLEARGMYIEECTHWYAAVYPT